MSRKDVTKLTVFICGMVAFMVGMWFVLKHFEAKEPEPVDLATADAGFLASAEPTASPTGELKIGKKKYQYYDTIETYLMIGTDGSGSQEGEAYQGSMADFLLLVVFNKSDNTYQFLQLNRDTMTEVRLLQKDGTGEATADIQLCTSHWYGGNEKQSCENTVEAVSKLLGGIQIDGYYSLNMEEIPRLNQLVDGVTVTLEEDFTSVDKKMKKGKTMRLSDEQAYHYIHDRYGVGDEENTSRMARQKQYMQSFFKEVMNKISEDKKFGADVFQNLQDVSTTNIKGKKISSMSDEISTGTNKGFLELSGETKLGKALGDGLDHVEFYPENDSIVTILTQLYKLSEIK